MSTDGVAEAPEVPGESPIVRATRLGQIKLVRILVEGGANINDRNDKNQSVLSIAVCSDTLEYPSLRDRLVLYIVNRGADVNNRDVYGRTPLMYACKTSAGLSVINILLHYGARSTDRDRFGNTALEYAKKRNNHDAIQQLVSSYEELNRTECNNNGGGGGGVFRRESSAEKYNLSAVLDLSSSANLPIGSAERSEVGNSLSANCAPQHRQSSRSLSSVPEGDCQGAPIKEKPTPRVKPQKVLRRRHTTDDLYGKNRAPGLHTLPSYLMDQRVRQTSNNVMQDLDEVYLEEKSTGKSREHILSWIEGIPASPSSSADSPSPRASLSPKGSDGQVQALGGRLARVCTVDEPTPGTSRAYHEPTDLTLGSEQVPWSRRPQKPVLRRQGSATQLLDELSYTRPGTLPALKVSPTRAIPSIGDYSWIKADGVPGKENN